MSPQKEPKSTFSKRIKQLLEEKGEPGKPMSQSQLARELTAHATAKGLPMPPMGFAQGRVTDWVNKPNMTVRVQTLIVIADYWGVTTDFLLGRTDERHAPWMVKPDTRRRSSGELDALAGTEDRKTRTSSPRAGRRSRASD